MGQICTGMIQLSDAAIRQVVRVGANAVLLGDQRSER
jgi:hypothetical protein